MGNSMADGMSVLELLRKAADGYEGGPGTVMEGLIDLMGLGPHVTHTECFDALAEKIEDELFQARREAVKESKKPMWWFRAAIERGEDWPEPRDGESFQSYLERCFLPRPRYDDGEPVQFGDPFLRWDGKGGNDGENVVEITVMSGDYYRWGLNGDCCTSQPVKRPRSVSGYDKLPLKVGETVWDVYTGYRYTVMGVLASERTVHLIHDESGKDVVLPASCLSHTPPDSREAIVSLIGRPAAKRIDRLVEEGRWLDGASR